MCPIYSEAKQTKMSQFRAEKVLLQDMQGEQVAPAPYLPQTPNSPKGFQQSILKGEVMEACGGCCKFLCVGIFCSYSK